jgi:phosphatidylserine synthase
MSATELNTESVNERLQDFTSGLPAPMAMCRLLLLIAYLLETLQDEGRDAEVILSAFIVAHEESRGDDA